MKTWLILMLVLSGCAATHTSKTDGPTRNLTEPEIRSLPPGTSFGDILYSLRTPTGSYLGDPVIFFPVEGRSNQRCGMVFDKHGRLLHAAMVPIPIGEEEIKDGIMLWPKEIAGMKISEFMLKQKKTEPNPESCVVAKPTTRLLLNKPDEHIGR